MRIVGGSLRGRVLNEFKDKGVRPTSDMARESLFNILHPINFIFDNAHIKWIRF